MFLSFDGAVGMRHALMYPMTAIVRMMAEQMVLPLSSGARIAPMMVPAMELSLFRRN